MPGDPSPSDSLDSRDLSDHEQRESFDQEEVYFPNMSPETAEALLKRLGGGVAEKHRAVEGVGFRARITRQGGGVSVEFDAHEELLDDLIRRFEDMAARES